MALPQSIDPTTLNLSGKPALLDVAPTSVTSAGGTGMPNARVENVNRPVNPYLGALFGGLLGYATKENLGLGTPSGTGTRPPTTPSGGGGTPSGGGGLPSGGSSLTGGTGSVNSVSLPAGTTQAEIDLQYGTTNGQSNYQISGVNTSTGQVVATPNYNIGGTNLGTNTGNFGFEAGTGTTTGGGATTGGDTTIGGGTTTTPTDTTQLANQYFQDSQGNIYDASGNLIYTSPKNQAPVTDDYITGGGYEPTPTTRPEYLQDSQGNVYDENGTLIYYNPSNAIPGTNDGGGGYDPNTPETEQYYEDSSGNIFDYSGNLVLEFGNGYYYEPDTGNFYDSNFDVVGDDFNAYQDFFDIPTYGGSDNYNYDFGDLGDYFDYENYTPGSTTYIKDGGSVRGGLATPLFRKGGSVPRFEDGGFINQVVANQMPQSVSTTSDEPMAMTTTALNEPTVTSGLQDTSSNPLTSNFLGSILDTVLGTAKQNPITTGAGLGALLTAALNSGSMAIPTNRGVDMTALGRLAPRTTPTSTRFVPYSEYGTPTTPYDYSQLYANLGVSPFGAGTGALSPSATPTSSVTAQPVTVPTTPTAPIGGLPSSPMVTTPPTASAPQYFQDADGNIYNANGDLLYDTTTGSTTPTAQQAVAPSTAQASVAPMSGLAVTTPEASSSYYSYGSQVDPTQILSSKNGGEISKFAFGGLSRAEGGSLHGNANIPTTASESHNPNVPIVQGRQDYREGAYVQGEGDGQSDDIPAMLADGEYVIDAETVAQLGNGSNKAGAKMLDTFRKNIRAHKRSAPTHKIPPKSKSPLAYLKGAK
jgi:hypothetical protein